MSDKRETCAYADTDELIRFAYGANAPLSKIERVRRSTCREFIYKTFVLRLLSSNYQLCILFNKL